LELLVGAVIQALLFSILAAVLSWGVIYKLAYGSSAYLSGQANLFSLQSNIRGAEEIFMGAAFVYWIFVNVLLVGGIFREDNYPKSASHDSAVFTGLGPLVLCVALVPLTWLGFLVAGITNSIFSDETISISAGLVSMVLSVVWLYYKEFVKCKNR